MVISQDIKDEIKACFKKGNDSKLLSIGILIGIIGSLIAGVINDLIKFSIFYPWIYLFSLIFILFILILVLLRPYFNWKIFMHQLDKNMKKIKNVLDLTKQKDAEG